MLGRPALFFNGSEQKASAGYRPMNLRRVYLEATAASMVLTAAHLASGLVVRSGQAGAIGDTLPSVDSLIAAFPDLTRGDTFDCIIVSSTANLNTLVAGAGMTLAGTTTVPASQMRQFLFTLTSEPKRTTVAPGSTTNGSAIITNLLVGPVSQTGNARLSDLGVGMGVSGAGIAGGTTVVAVNLSNGTLTLSANATATADNVALTFAPQMEARGTFTAAI